MIENARDKTIFFYNDLSVLAKKRMWIATCLISDGCGWLEATFLIYIGESVLLEQSLSACRDALLYCPVSLRKPMDAFSSCKPLTDQDLE